MQYTKPQLEELGSVHALTLKGKPTFATGPGQGQENGVGIPGANPGNPSGKTPGIGDGVNHADNGFS